MKKIILIIAILLTFSILHNISYSKRKAKKAKSQNKVVKGKTKRGKLSQKQTVKASNKYLKFIQIDNEDMMTKQEIVNELVRRYNENKKEINRLKNGNRAIKRRITKLGFRSYRIRVYRTVWKKYRGKRRRSKKKRGKK